MTIYRMSLAIAAPVLLLLAAAPVLADDLRVQLGSGDDFVVEDSSATERLRVDDATGTVSMGTANIDGGTIDGSILRAPRTRGISGRRRHLDHTPPPRTSRAVPSDSRRRRQTPVGHPGSSRATGREQRHLPVDGSHGSLE